MKTENEVLKLIAEGKIFELVPNDFYGRFMTKKEMEAIFNHFNAIWVYDGDPSAEKPHALLKSGGHSNGFLSCKEVLENPRMCALFAYEVLKHLNEIIPYEEVDFVASSAYSAISLGWEITRLISEYNPNVVYVIVEKDKDGNPTVIRGGIDSSKTGIIINELMTTAKGSTWETKEAVLKCNGENSSPMIIGKSFVLVHRSRDYQLPDGTEVIPIFHFNIQNFTPEECPYCKAGSTAIKPKVGNNWSIIHNRT